MIQFSTEVFEIQSIRVNSGLFLFSITYTENNHVIHNIVLETKSNR